MFSRLICGGDRSSRLRENAEGAKNAPADKSQKTPARETRNRGKDIMCPNQCRVEKVLINMYEQAVARIAPIQISSNGPIKTG